MNQSHYWRGGNSNEGWRPFQCMVIWQGYQQEVGAEIVEEDGLTLVETGMLKQRYVSQGECVFWGQQVVETLICIRAQGRVVLHPHHYWDSQFEHCEDLEEWLNACLNSWCINGMTCKNCGTWVWLDTMGLGKLFLLHHWHTASIFQSLLHKVHIPLSNVTSLST